MNVICHLDKIIVVAVIMCFVLGTGYADNWKASSNAVEISGAITPNSANTDLGVGITAAPTWKTEIRTESTATNSGGGYKALRLSTSATSGTNITLSASPTSGNYFVLSAPVGAGFIFSTGSESSSGIGTERIRILSSNGNMGIGTTTIGSRLQVNGNAAIGYAASTAAPTNGLVVNGNVGIGITNPTSKLAVNGTIRAKEVIVTT